MMKPSIKFEVFSASCFEGVFDCMPKNFWGRVTSVTPLLGNSSHISVHVCQVLAV